jgi:hypothetical protein
MAAAVLIGAVPICLVLRAGLRRPEPRRRTVTAAVACVFAEALAARLTYPGAYRWQPQEEW